MKGQRSIKGIPLEEIVRIFYNNAKPVGWGLMHYIDRDITDEECKNVVKVKSSRAIPAWNISELLLDLDYLAGRLIKIRIWDDYSIDYDEWNKYYKEYDENKEKNPSGKDLIDKLREKYPEPKENNNESSGNHSI